jgi:O-antigen/teichoic acid export membrane protein
MKAMQINTNLQNLLKLILTFSFFYFYGASVFTLIAAYLLSFLIATLFSFVSVSYHKKDLPSHEGTIQMKKLLREIVPFGLMISLMYSLDTLLSSADRLLLGYMIEPSLSTSVVAVYSIATLLAALITIFPAAIGSIFLPIMSRLYGKNCLADMRSMTHTAQRWSLFITLPVASILISFSAEMLEIFYGAAYVGGAMVMSIIVFAALLASISSVLSLALTSMKVVKLQLKILFFIALLNILLDILLIPIYGMVGAAIAFLVSAIFTVLIFCHYSKIYFDFQLSTAFHKLLLAALITLLIVFLLKPSASDVASMLPQWGGGVLLYFSKFVYLAYLGVLTGFSFLLFMSFALLLKCFKDEDVVLMRKAMRKVKIPEFLISVAEAMATHGVAKSFAHLGRKEQKF